jgi:Methyltransferase domain
MSTGWRQVIHVSPLLGVASVLYVSVYSLWSPPSALYSDLVHLASHRPGGGGSGGGSGGGEALSDLEHNRRFPLAVPRGQPPNLPRIEVAEQENSGGAEGGRGIYGGKNDGKHLGGFTEFDPHGVSPTVWANMMTELGVHSMMDVGCGRGTSTRWFLEHNVKVLCVEGSHDAVSQSFLPNNVIVEHDYSRGPWWPQDTYDAVWSVEFLEHVNRQFQYNYIQTFRKAALIFVSSSRWGGWHHVEVQSDQWWIRQFTSHGFVYDEELTDTVRGWAARDGRSNYTLPTGGKPNPQHVYTSMKVFINPAVASLPEHAHLFPRHGCIGKPLTAGPNRFEARECGTGPSGAKETPLAPELFPLPVTPEMHERWIQVIKGGMKQQSK